MVRLGIFGRLRHRGARNGATVDDLIDLLFPGGLDAAYGQQVRTLLDGTEALSPSSIRQALSVVEQQLHHSRIQVRWNAVDIDFVDIDGIQLALERVDPLGISVAAGSYEPHITAVLRAHVKDGDTFVDVGANIGVHTFRASRIVGAAGRVVAIEANPENARLLSYTALVNDVENVQVLPFACSTELGSTYFTNMIGSNGGVVPSTADELATGRGFVVPTVKLDDLGLSRVDVMKIDVEGAEGLVTEGGAHIIQRDRPVVISEMSFEMLERVSGMSAEQYLARFVDLGYEISIINRASNGTELINPAELIEDWGDYTRIEDLLLLPK
jgi:FkbM family methyltransferase